MKKILLITLIVISPYQYLLNAQDRIRGSYTYQYGDRESLIEARQYCKNLALREAVESYSLFIQSTTAVENFNIKSDMIQTIASGTLKNIKVIENIEEKNRIKITVEATVDPEQIKKIIDYYIDSDNKQIPFEDNFDPLESKRHLVNQYKEQIIDIQNQSKLGFRSFTLCANIIGFGQYIPIKGNKVKAGTTLYFYYEPENLFTNRMGGNYQMWFTQDMIVLTEDGEELYNAPDLLNFNYQTRSPVFDVHASNSLELGNLPQGKYIYMAIMHDKLKKADATYIFKFEVIE